MESIALHFGGPLQSWATGALVKTRVDTDRAPSERAIRGLIASCFGVPRGADMPRIVAKAKITVRTIKSGSKVRDFQTIGNRSDEVEYHGSIGRILNRGKASLKISVADNGGFNSIVRRSYLADASFIVLIEGENSDDTGRILEAIKNPVWSPYLGRKAFAPTFPFFLGVFSSDIAPQNAEQKLNEIQGAIHGNN